MLPSKYDPFSKVKPLNLAELFAKFAATVIRPNDQPGYMGVEELSPWQQREVIKQEIEREEI